MIRLLRPMLLMGAVLVVAALTSGAGALAAVSATYTVSSTADDPDVSTGDGVCKTASGVCTLRAAIAQANTHPGPDTIAFDIPPALPGVDAVRTIQLQGELPALTGNGTTIDGYTQAGAQPNTDPLASNAKIRVEVRGNGASGHDALRIHSSDNVLRGLAFYNLRRSLVLDGKNVDAKADRNRISGCFIGTDATGTFRHTSAVFGPSHDTHAHGIVLQRGAADNHIGEATLAGRNVISGNSVVGIITFNDGSDRNTIVNNIMGLSPDGTRAVPNWYAVDINSNSSENVIGGDGDLARNVISGNHHEAVEISHGPGTANNQTVGNFLGTDLTGTRVFEYTRNGTWGIQLQDRAQRNVFRHNVVGGNRLGGIRLAGTKTIHTTENTFEENWIGVARDGSAIPNLGPGVQLQNYVSRNRVGPGNVIAHNAGSGIELAGNANLDTTSDFNTITRNSVYANGGLGIDIKPLGGSNLNDRTDADSGPNDQLNYPVLKQATTSEIMGTACAGCTVEVFAADDGAGSYGEGKTFVGSVAADSNGAFAVPASGVGAGQYVTGTATDAQGNTSEFSLNVQLSGAP